MKESEKIMCKNCGMKFDWIGIGVRTYGNCFCFILPFRVSYRSCSGSNISVLRGVYVGEIDTMDLFVSLIPRGPKCFSIYSNY